MAANTNIDFSRPFQYVFEDQDWIRKVLTGGAIFFGSVLTCALLVGLAGLFVLFGYQRRVVLQVAEGKDVPLPEFDQWGDDIMAGAKMFGITIVWALPGILVRLLGMVVMFALAATGSDAAAQAGGFVVLATTCIGLPLSLAGGIFGLLGILRFMDTGDFASGFQVSELIGLVKRQFVNLLLWLVIAMIAGFVAEIAGFILCFVGIFFTVFLAQLVSGHALGQVLRLDRAARGTVG